ncbi:hypothetical protein BUALT_Bualt11G0103000 [Buddleja alternifolia]|uniref:Cytochrome P450 n=1 Tax=Buddleja alternifolia TaxID=168488 RepID=A0AAV6X4N8_9LAMI|nr:hypothetical protein BUALT_Bualt11G0103000 [Buddleja alternifolia]
MALLDSPTWISTKLQSKYGPILWLKLGTVNTVVIQSAATAAKLFKKHDLPFSDRRVFDSLTACDYHKGSLAQAHYGKYWRRVRRLCSSELTVHKRINASAPLRRISIDKMIEWIKEDVSKFGEIQLNKYLFFMTHNLIGNIMLGRDVMDLHSEKGNQFFEATNQFMKWNGTPNIVDVFGFVKERIEERKLGKESRDFLDALLEFEGDGKGGIEKLSQKNVTIIIMGRLMEGYRRQEGRGSGGDRADWMESAHATGKARDQGTVVLQKMKPGTRKGVERVREDVGLTECAEHTVRRRRRRSCIGMLLGERVVTLTLARLVQCFDWELPMNESPDTMDMREMMGISLRKFVPLNAVPRERFSL